MPPLEPSAMTDNSRLLASRLVALAEEIFARANRVHDADIREKIHAIAAGYERLAQLVGNQSREGQRGAPHAGSQRLAPHSLRKPVLETLATRRGSLRARGLKKRSAAFASWPSMPQKRAGRPNPERRRGGRIGGLPRRRSFLGTATRHTVLQGPER